MNKKRFTKKALTLSVCLLIIWLLMGTGTTIAWFTDVTPVDKNHFDIGTIDLQVSYKDDDLTRFVVMNERSQVFRDDALYEPGYTQVIYLEIINTGEIDFDYKLSLDVRDYHDSMNVYGMLLHLPEYLRYGVMFGDSVPDLEREVAQGLATGQFEPRRLNQYSSEDIRMKPGDIRYAAVILYMPKEVGNAANHLTVYEPPTVSLGVTVFAQQAGAPME